MKRYLACLLGFGLGMMVSAVELEAQNVTLGLRASRGKLSQNNLENFITKFF